MKNQQEKEEQAVLALSGIGQKRNGDRGQKIHLQVKEKEVK